MKKAILLLMMLVNLIVATAQIKGFLIPYRQGNRWGFCDTLGKVLIPATYDSTSFLSKSQSVSTEYGKVFSAKNEGVISFAGKPVVPPRYAEVSGVNNHFLVRKNNKFGLYNNSGKLVVPVMYDGIEPADFTYAYFNLTLNGRHGLYSPRLGQSIPPVYDFILDDYFTTRADPEKWFFAKKGKERFLINKQSGKTVVYKGIDHSAEVLEGAPPMQDLMEVQESAGKEVEKIKQAFAADTVQLYKNIEHEYMLATKTYLIKKAGKTGLAFANGLPLLKPEYDSVTYAMNLGYDNHYLKKKSYYLLAVKKGLHFGLVNEVGEEILPFRYDLINSLPGYANAFQLHVDDKTGVFLPTTFYPAILPVYDSIRYETQLEVNPQWSFPVFKVVRNGLPGYVGENGIEYFK